MADLTSRGPEATIKLRLLMRKNMANFFLVDTYFRPSISMYFNVLVFQCNMEDIIRKLTCLTDILREKITPCRLLGLGGPLAGLTINKNVSKHFKFTL